jgi:hypothetical protein
VRTADLQQFSMDTSRSLAGVTLSPNRSIVADLAAAIRGATCQEIRR